MQKKLLSLLAVFILANLAFLNYLAFSKSRSFEDIMTVAPTPTQKVSIKQDVPCTQDCVNDIYAAIATLSAQEQQTAANTAANTASSTTEFFVPFGSGSVPGGNTWQDVPGLQTYVDTTQYDSIKQVVFEVSVYIPTGNQTASVQVYNVTAQHPVWNSVVNFPGGANPQFLISSPVTLDPGNNLYKIQMQTQLQYPANITQARFHITTN